MKYYFTFD